MSNSTGISTVVVGDADTNFAGTLVEFMGDSGAKNFDITGASGNSTEIKTDTTGAVDVDVTAQATATSASPNNNQGELTFTKAASLDLSIAGEVTLAGTVTATKATSVTVTNTAGQAQTTALVAAAAETVTITSGAKGMTLSNASDLTGAKVVTIDTTGAFQDSSGTSATEGLLAASDVNLSGTGSKASITIDELVGATDLGYALDVDATGLEAGLTFDQGLAAGTDTLDIDLTGTTGAVDLATNNTVSGGTVNIRKGVVGTLDTGVVVGTKVSINAADSVGAITIGSGADGVSYGTKDIEGNNVTIVGSLYNANSADIISKSDATSMTVSLTGGADADLFSIKNTATVKTTTVSGDLGLGADKVYVEIVDFSTDGTSTVTFTAADLTTDTLLVNVDATSNELSITGTSGTGDTIDVGTTNYSTNDATISGFENMTIGNGTVTFDSSTLTGQTIAITGVSSDVVAIVGSSVGETFSSANLTSGGNSALTIDMAAGADTITLGAMDETVTLATGSIDTINDFTSGTDKLDLSGHVASTTETAITSAAAAGNSAVADATYFVITTDGTAADITTSGSATLAAADYTADTLTNVAAYLSEQFTAAGTAADAGVFVLNDSVSGEAFVYLFTEATPAAAGIVASELELVGILNDTVIATGDFV
jgi:hypothetical protein